MAQYAVAAGFIQKFPDKPAVNVREANGGSVRDVTIKTIGAQKLVRVTIWPEYGHVAINEGDFIVAEGKFEVSEFNGQRYSNVSASKLLVNGTLARKENEVVNQVQSGPTPAQAADAPASTGNDDIPF